ncbi:hypothetical protein [Cohnella nanjingensis]|nr:hypothetical protein [Cohnella nanjingensis]
MTGLSESDTVKGLVRADGWMDLASFLGVILFFFAEGPQRRIGS